MTIPYLSVEVHLREVEPSDLERILRVLHEMGGTYTVIEHTIARAVEVPPDVPDPAPLPPPSPWWELLEVTEPRTKIYAAREGVQIYYSAGPTVAPSFDQTALTSAGLLWKLPFNKDVEVWRVPIAGSGWICVAILAQRALWVRAEDMRMA